MRYCWISVTFQQWQVQNLENAKKTMLSMPRPIFREIVDTNISTIYLVSCHWPEGQWQETK